MKNQHMHLISIIKKDGVMEKKDKSVDFGQVKYEKCVMWIKVRG